MKTRTKSIIKVGLFGGIVYALVMLGFDFTAVKNFNVWKFIFNLSSFGILIGFMIYYNLKKQVKKYIG
jgi:dipeptide/tripeptide permease